MLYDSEVFVIMSLLNSYVYYNKEMDVSLAYEVLKILDKTTSTYGYYIQGYTCKNAEERRQIIDAIKQNTLLHVLRKYSPAKGSLKNYVNSIQKNILRVNVKTVDIEKFLDALDARLEGTEETVDLQDIPKSSSGLSNKKTFDEELIDELCNEEELFLAVEKLALEEPLSFIYLCDAILSKDTSVKNKYDKLFMKRVLEMMRTYDGFNDFVSDFYLQHGDTIITFMTLEEKFDGIWKPYSKEVLENSKSKRLTLVGKNRRTASNIDPDLEPFNILGNNITGGKEERQILRVNYSSILEMVDEMFRTQNSPLRLCFKDNYVLRTLAGEYSIINVSIRDWVDVQKLELITNIVSNLDAKLLGVGLDNLYLLSKPHYKPSPLNFVRYSIPIKIVPEVITKEVRFV